MQHVFEILFSLSAAVLSVLCSYKIYQVYQLSSYKAKGVINWLKISKFEYIIRYFCLSVLAFLGMFVFIACFNAYKYVQIIGVLFFIGFCLIFFFTEKKQEKKTPLKHTYRMMRMIVMSGILYALMYYGLLRLARLVTIGYSITAIGLFLMPIIVTIAYYFLLPFEILNNNGYKRRAVSCLNSMPQLIKIGITGSYGKTTTKYILAKMLEKKYKVCYSPKSYNTPMGISMVVNRDLKPEHDVFIAEMGARNVGDIAELAKMIQPNYGMITAIGNQHLETFGSIENIAATKYELIENLSLGGLAVFNGESEIAAKMYQNCKTEKFITGSKGVPDASAYYDNVKVSTKGTSFDLNIYNDTITIETVLLGKHIPALITMCARLAANLDVSLNDIKTACSELAPVEHRLQLIDRGDMIVIDDAYNSNPEGAKNALELLSMFEDSTKIIVTPGLVELGSSEKELNEKLGETIAKCADYAVLLGFRAKDIANGAKLAEMAEDKIIFAETVTDAVEKLNQIDGKKVVLFENDLPDNYN